MSVGVSRDKSTDHSFLDGVEVEWKLDIETDGPESCAFWLVGSHVVAPLDRMVIGLSRRGWMMSGVGNRLNDGS